MCSYDSLPVVLVSAADAATADAFIAEIIDNDVTESYCKKENGVDPVWRLVNKYYTADVRIQVLTDQEQLQQDPENVEAHIIYLSGAECSDGSARVGLAEKREELAGAAGRDAAVRLVAASCVEADSDLDSWAARRRRELVALQEAPPADPGPFEEQCGVERLRGALHAHPWSGMVRAHSDRTAPVPLLGRTSSESSEGSGGSAEDSVERVEEFAAALAALEAARDSRHTDTSRLDRAEHVVAAFCRALGYDLDKC